jgi:hypothetical protein
MFHLWTGRRGGKQPKGDSYLLVLQGSIPMPMTRPWYGGDEGPVRSGTFTAGRWNQQNTSNILLIVETSRQIHCLMETCMPESPKPGWFENRSVGMPEKILPELAIKEPVGGTVPMSH